MKLGERAMRNRPCQGRRSLIISGYVGADRGARNPSLARTECSVDELLVLRAHREKLVRVQGDALLAHLEVQVRAGDPASGADRSDGLALEDHVSHLHQALGKMRVAGGEAV